MERFAIYEIYRTSFSYDGLTTPKVGKIAMKRSNYTIKLEGASGRQKRWIDCPKTGLIEKPMYIHTSYLLAI